MFDHGAHTTARACGYRVRVPATGVRCWRPVTRMGARGTAIGQFAAVARVPVMFQHAERGHGAYPTPTTKRRRLRPSEYLM